MLGHMPPHMQFINTLNADWRPALLAGKMNHVIALNFNIWKQEVCCHVYCFVVCVTSDSYTTMPVLTLLAQIVFMLQSTS
jgi:hypothetical protein